MTRHVVVNLRGSYSILMTFWWQKKSSYQWNETFPPLDRDSVDMLTSVFRLLVSRFGDSYEIEYPVCGGVFKGPVTFNCYGLYQNAGTNVFLI